MARTSTKRKHQKHEEKKGKNKSKIFNGARPLSFSSLLSLKLSNFLSDCYFSDFSRYQEQNEPKNAQNLPADLSETTNNRQKVRLKSFACLCSANDFLRSVGIDSGTRFHYFACNFLVRYPFYLKFASFFLYFLGAFI
jgi:hypothetical protein